MQLPSKELLSEVLGKDVCKVKEIENNTLIYGCLVHDGWYDEINIHELANKCKEWAYRKGYSLISGVFIVADDNGNAVFDYFNSCLINYIEKENRNQVLNNFKSDTEAESILKACEWIIKNK